MRSLTEKQQEVLDFIEKFAHREGMAPTVYEVADYFDIKPPTSFAHLRALQRKGYLSRSSKARSIALTHSDSGRARSLLLDVPVVGRVAAGAPLLAEEQIESHLQFDPVMLPRGSGGHKIFGLRVFGESMRELGILDGDIVIVKQVHSANLGDIVVAMVNNETTVKSLYIAKNGKVELRPANAAYKSQYYAPEDVNIQGVVIGLQRVYA